MAPRHICWRRREYAFRDARLPELLFRYRARNWPGTLTQPEQRRWDAYRRQRLNVDGGLSELTFESYFREIDALRAQHADDGSKQALLDHLQAWGNDLQITLSGRRSDVSRERTYGTCFATSSLLRRSCMATPIADQLQ